jgi:hypothetical protein
VPSPPVALDAQPAAVAPAAEPVVNEMSPETKKAFEELTAFIDQNYSQGVDIDIVSLQLTMASATGRIPKAVFDNAINGPFDDLYANIKTVAIEKGYKGLVTPKGLSYCQKIYKILNPNASTRRKKKND